MFFLGFSLRQTPCMHVQASVITFSIDTPIVCKVTLKHVFFWYSRNYRMHRQSLRVHKPKCHAAGEPQSRPTASPQEFFPIKGELFKTDKSAESNAQRAGLWGSVFVHFTKNIASKDIASLEKLFPNFRRLFLTYWWSTMPCHHGHFWDPGKMNLRARRIFKNLSSMLHYSVLSVDLQELGPNIPAFKQLVCFGGADPDCIYQ